MMARRGSISLHATSDKPPLRASRAGLRWGDQTSRVWEGFRPLLPYCGFVPTGFDAVVGTTREYLHRSGNFIRNSVVRPREVGGKDIYRVSFLGSHACHRRIVGRDGDIRSSRQPGERSRPNCRDTAMAAMRLLMARRGTSSVFRCRLLQVSDARSPLRHAGICVRAASMPTTTSRSKRLPRSPDWSKTIEVRQCQRWRSYRKRPPRAA